ncbi:MAG: BrnT family toxin [Sphingomonadaceae bacterium]
MEIEYDPAKRETTLRERGLDFEDFPDLFMSEFVLSLRARDGPEGEERFITFAAMEDEAVIAAVWTVRGTRYRVMSMRKARRNERQTFWNAFRSRSR